MQHTPSHRLARILPALLGLGCFRVLLRQATEAARCPQLSFKCLQRYRRQSRPGSMRGQQHLAVPAVPRRQRSYITVLHPNQLQLRMILAAAGSAAIGAIPAGSSRVSGRFTS